MGKLVLARRAKTNFPKLNNNKQREKTAKILYIIYKDLLSFGRKIRNTELWGVCVRNNEF